MVEFPKIYFYKFPVMHLQDLCSVWQHLSYTLHVTVHLSLCLTAVLATSCKVYHLLFIFSMHPCHPKVR